MRKVVDGVVTIALLVAVAYWGWTHQPWVLGAIGQIEAKVRPCANPISYSIGSIDPKFGVSKNTFLADLKEAEAIWEKPSGKNLFQHSVSGGAVTVNLVYDQRQAATDTLKNAGVLIDRSKSSYDSLKSQYDALIARVKNEQEAYDRDVGAYKSAEASYNAEVKKWNDQGGAPPPEYQRLQEKKAALTSELSSVHAEEAALNSHIDTLNALATKLNQLIVQLNLNVEQYNRAGSAQGEFEEGLYVSAAGVQKIDIYEFSNHTELVRVLAHEMGHALGLDHVQDKDAIMYKINAGSAQKATAADTEALTAKCSSGIL